MDFENISRNGIFKVVICVFFWAAYFWLFAPLYDILGETVFLMAMLPAIITGGLFGIEAGFTGGAIVTIVDFLMLELMIGQPKVLTIGFIMGHLFVFVVGMAFGRMRNLRDRIKEEFDRYKATRDREEFLHSLLRHDVANKLNTAKGFMQLLSELPDLNEESRDSIGSAMSEINRGLDLIEKVRTLRKVGEGEISQVNLTLSIKESIEKNEEILDKKGIEVNNEIEDKIEIQVGPLLEELFNNLFENAVKHADCEMIRVGSEIPDDGTVKIIFEDNGCGIPSDIEDEMMERGVKGRGSTGSGLGMYLVKNIVKEYDGKIEVKDSKMGGARFEINFNKAE